MNSDNLFENIVLAFVLMVMLLFMSVLLKAIYQSFFCGEGTTTEEIDTHGFPEDVYFKLKDHFDKQNILISDDQWKLLLDEYKVNGLVILEENKAVTSSKE